MDTKKLRQKILDLAIHGKLVPQDPNDEPASVLLERIKAEKEQLIKEGKIKRQKKSTSSDTSHYGNDVPFEVPDGWVWCRLKDITELIEDCPHSTAPDEGKGYPLIRTPNVGEGHLILKGVHRVSQKVYENRTTRAIPKYGDIIYAREAPAGNAAVIAENETVCLGQRTVLIRPFGEYVDPMLLTYFMLSPYSKNTLISRATGSTVQHVNMEMIRPLYVPIPPLNEQIRIVTEIKHYFNIIDQIEQGAVTLNATIGKAKSKILDLALSGKLTSHTSHYGKNAEYFSETTLGTVCKLCDGEKITGKDYTNMDVKYLRGTKSGDTLHSGKFVPSGSLMILVDGENSGEVFTAPIDGYQGSTFKILDIDAKYCKEFILLLIQSNRKSLRENKVGSAIPHLNKKMFKEIAVPSFSYREQCEIAKTVKDYFFVLDSIVG